MQLFRQLGVKDNISRRVPPLEQAVQKSHWNRDPAPSAIALDPKEPRRGKVIARNDRIETAASKKTERLKDAGKHRAFLCQSGPPFDRQIGACRASELPAFAGKRLLKDAFDNRRAVLRVGYPYLDRRTGQRLVFPNLRHYWIMRAAPGN